jgi:hypothetical protein
MGCGRTFVWNSLFSKQRRQRIWFKRWVTEGYTIKQIAVQSGHSTRTVRRIIQRELRYPAPILTDLSKHRYLILDGTFLDRRKGVFAVMDGESFSLIHAAPEMAEGPAHLLPFCSALAHRGLMPVSATVDGNPHLIQALRSVWPNILIQRCLVHIQRQGLMWCRRYPKRTDAKHLRSLFLQIPFIRSLSERDRFLAQLGVWEYRYGKRIARSKETGWIFSDLKRARSMLLGALPNMFRYLDDPKIVTCTNALEGYFARLKHRYRQHRGLAAHHRNAYLNWFIHLCRR